MTTEQRIKEIKEKIASAVSPEKIILFGSCANGRATSESDIDLAVIWDTNLDFHKRNVFLSRLFPKRDFSLDVFAFTRKEAEMLKNTQGTILYEAFHNGRVIYG